MSPCSVHLLVPPYSPLIPVSFPPWKKTKQSKQLRKQKEEQQPKKVTEEQQEKNKTKQTKNVFKTAKWEPAFQRGWYQLGKLLITVSHPFLTFASQWLTKFLYLDLFFFIFKHRIVNKNTQVLPQFLIYG